MKRFALKLILLYQKYLSIDHGLIGKIFAPNTKICIFEPTCSTYTYEAVDKYGIFKGTFLGVKRVLRCNPYSKGGYDPLK